MAEGIAGAPPSWDDTTPAEAAVQRAAPKVAPAAPPPAPPVADAPAATPPPQAPVPDVNDAPPAFDDTAPVESPAPGPDPLAPVAPSPQLQKLVNHNLQVYNAVHGKGPHEAGGFLEALQAGYQMSVTGLIQRQGLPDTVLPEHAPMALRIANQIGSLAGDLPAMVAGGFAGGSAGTVAGGVAGSAVPVAGTFAGAALGGATGAAAGAFAAPAAMRKIMIDHYERGDIQSAGEFAERAMATGWEATKGAVTGIATAILGPVAGKAGEAAGKLVGPMAAKVAGEAGAFLGNVGTMTTVGAGLEGHLPTGQDFIDGAIVMGGLHATTALPAKFREIYAKTGEHPHQVAAAMEADLQLKQAMLTEDPTSPPQAHPTELKYPEKEEWDPAPVEGAEKGPQLSPDEKLAAATPRLEPVSTEIPEPILPVEERSTEVSDVLSKIGTAPEKSDPTWSDTWRNFYAKNVDYLDPLAVALADAKKNGVEVPSEKNAYEQGRLYAAHLDKIRSFVEIGTRDAKTGEINGEGLNTILREIPKGSDGKPDLDGYRAYSMARRALELDERGINPWEGFSRSGAQAVVEQGAKKFEAINRRRVDFENRILQYAGDKGLFSKKQLEAMRQMNEHHIPFYRVMDPDTWTGKTPGGNVVKRIYGSDRAILDPIESSYRNVEAIIKRADANDIRKNFVDTMETPEMRGEWVERVEEKMLPQQISEKELAQHLQKQGIEISADELNPLTVFRPEKGMLKDNEFAVYRDGQRIVYTGEPGVIDSLRRLDGNSTAMSAWSKTMAGFTKATRIGVTADPGFGFRHFFRSQIMTGVYTKTGQIPFYHSALAMGEFMKGESEAYKNWVYDGGGVSSWDRLDENYIKNNLEGANKKAPFHEQAWNLITSPLHASEAFIKMTDNLSRFTEYKRTVDQGGSRAEAAFASREVTVDYQKQGLQRSALRAGVAFIGAHINSLDRMAQAFEEQPKGTVAKLAALSAVSAMLWVANKDDEAIQALPNWQKDLYWNFRVPGASSDGTAIIFRLPKPWAAGILFGSGVETALDAWKGTSPSRADDFANTLLHSVVPEPIPNMIGPVLEQWSNKSLFSGRPIVSQDKEKLLPELQYQPYTSETAKQLGKLIGYVPYVRDIGPSSDKLASPAVVENYIHGWTGTLGGWALKISDAGLHAAGVGSVKAEEAKTIADNPFMRQFVSRYPSLKDQPIEDFYNNLDHTSRVLESIKYANRKGDTEHAAEISARYPDLEIKLSGIAKGISTARKVMQGVQDNPSIPAVEKRQLVDSTLFQIHSMAKMGNQMMKDFQKSVSPDEGE